jgi:hypothetical protein
VVQYAGNARGGRGGGRRRRRREEELDSQLKLRLTRRSREILEEEFFQRTELLTRMPGALERKRKWV